MAAVLALSDGAVLSHRAAAELWELLPPSRGLHVAVPRTAGHVARDGITVHRAALPAADTKRRSGIGVTSLPRTLLDLAATVDADTLAVAFEEAQVIHQLHPLTMVRAIEKRSRRRGTAAMRALLMGAVDPTGVRSPMELRFLRLCADQHIPRPLVNGRIGPWRPDFLWREHHLVVETDGGRFHQSLAKRERDERKDAALTAQGLTVLRLRWHEVVYMQADTAARVLDALVECSSR